MEQRNEELFRAVKDGRLQSVIRCLKYGADINCQTQDGDYPIHIAAAEGYTEIVQLLLDRGIDCNLKARHTKSSPLHLAAERGHLKTTELLLMGGGNPNNKNWRGESPLHRPAGDGHLNVVVLLLDANSDHNMAAKYGRTPLFYAVESGRLNTTSVLLERGSDSNLKNIFGDTVLHLAAECKHPDIFRILLTSGSDPRIKNKSGETPYDSFKRVFSDSVETRKLNLTVLEMLGLIQAKEREKEEEARILKELRGLGLETASDMLEVIKLGYYKCYWNRVYLVGPYYSGKSCLAKILVGEPIPKERESTDGIWIYMGKAGMDIEETKWKCFPKGDAIKEVLTSMLMSISKPENIEAPVSHFHTSQTDLTLVSTIERCKKHVTKVDMEFEDKISHMNPVVLNKSFDTPILKSDIQHFQDDKNNISDFPCNTSCWQDTQPITSPVDIDSTVHECYVASKIIERNDFGGLPVNQNASDDLNNEKKEYRGLPIDKINTSDVLDEEPNNFGGLPFDCNATNLIDNSQLDFGGLSVDCSASHAVDNEQKKYARLPVDISASHMQAVDNKSKNFGELPVYHNAFYHSNEESKFNASSYNSLEESNISNLDINVQDNSAKEKYMLKVPDAVKGSFIGVPTSASSLSTATSQTRTLPIIHLSDNDPNDFREAPINHSVSRVSTEKKRLSSSSNTSEFVQYKEKLMEKITSELSHKNIHQLVVQAIADGKYKQTVIPIDIWDFGGQKDYYMTHQLFITSRGIFVLIFNGSIGLHKTRRDLAFLPGHFGKPTVAVYLIHWVNSILTYSKRLDEGFPRILFVATHKDKISEKKLESHRNKLMDQIEDLFKSHAGRAHLEFKPLLFINAINEIDPEIEALRMRLMNRAVEHPRWGELMPTTWVPLELQLLMEVENGVNIMSKAKLKMLNSQNEPMVLTEKQLETFLRVQHSLGKLLYFNTTTLRNYVIIKPAYLVEVLRSIVTEKQFWIKGKRFSRVLQTLRDTGFIDRWDIYSIWNQVSFKQILPYKVFMIEVLVHLDVLVAPQTENEDLHHNIERVSRFLVPCMITRPNKTKYMKKFCTSKTSIIMSYTFIEEVIPPALTYRFLGSFVTIWGVKNYKGKKRMLFSDLAVVEVDKCHDVAVQVVKNRVVVYLIHSERKEDIVPTLASSVQECLTAAVYRISEFYSTLSEESKTVQQKSHMVMPFNIEFGVHYQKALCFFQPKDMPVSGQDQVLWCSCHKQSHDVNCLRLWFSEKIYCERCNQSCNGLGEIEIEQCPEEKHLRRLVARLTHDCCRKLFIELKMETSIWEDISQQFQHLHPDDLKFTSLIRWKEGRENPTFQDIIDALGKCNLDKHLLCQVFRDVVPVTSGIPDDILTQVPPTTTLQCLANHIGNSSMQLGVELGITMSEIQNIQYEHKDKLLNQTKEILRIWQQKKAPRSTNLSLIKALHRIGKINCISMIR